MKREEKALFLTTFLTIVFFFATLSGPLAEALPVKKALLAWGPAEEKFEDFEARAIMTYHVAAVVVMSMLAYLALRYVEMDSGLKPLAANLITAGFSIPSGVIFAYFWRSPLIHTLWIIGLMFTAALVILYAISPFRISWNTLKRVTFFTVGVCLAIMWGGVYVSHFGFEKGMRLVRTPLHNGVQRIGSRSRSASGLWSCPRRNCAVGHRS